ncbi:ECF transporter S component [Schaalia sp. ZJ405]|uniref:ECF transporter S component n=1 Tax=Schaalia sp. ZJ405 TaxID=2709403 RepID=UPI0013ED1DA9|nr:ECF transporter S component [Schaalia sp. ZJ405]QPK81372.1 ECF transporter S component [Schaalia sp. ZJ405]
MADTTPHPSVPRVHAHEASAGRKPDNPGHAGEGPEHSTQPSLKWRVVDIVTAAVLGVTCAVIIFVWNQIYGLGGGVIGAALPGLEGVFLGGWLLGGTLGALIIRKPGAALFVEVVAAALEAAIGSQFGPTVVLSGLAQGFGVEIVFAILLYRRYTALTATLSGAVSGLCAWGLELFMYAYIEKGPAFIFTYLVCCVISGALLAGLGGWAVTRGLARTGALDRFAAGREVRTRV